VTVPRREGVAALLADSHQVSGIDGLNDLLDECFFDALDLSKET
jgi:hypothetical protein